MKTKYLQWISIVKNERKENYCFKTNNLKRPLGERSSVQIQPYVKILTVITRAKLYRKQFSPDNVGVKSTNFWPSIVQKMNWALNSKGPFSPFFRTRDNIFRSGIFLANSKEVVKDGKRRILWLNDAFVKPIFLLRSKLFELFLSFSNAGRLCNGKGLLFNFKILG